MSRILDNPNACGSNELKQSDIGPSFVKRKFIRHSSVILANTGERVRLLQGDHNFNYSSAILEGDSNVNAQNDPLNTGFMLKRLLFSNKDVIHNVLKCSIAYLIASFGVYSTKFDHILGHSDSKHVVATVAVYFHPARSKGSMFQSLLFVILSLLFSFCFSFGSRSLSSFFYRNGMEATSNTIDLLISSFALGLIAYSKQKVNKPTFNTACSLASISIVACITKEGSMNQAEIPIERLISTLRVVVAGCLISVIACYALWPRSSVQVLRTTLNESFNIISQLLHEICDTFLEGREISAHELNTVESLKKNISVLYKCLEEVEYELKAKGRESEYYVFEKMVNSTASLARNLQGIQSSTEIQWKLLREQITKTKSSSVVSVHSSDEDTADLPSSADPSCWLESPGNAEQPVKLLSSAELFELFVQHLGPSMKSFIFTVRSILMQIPFESREFPKTFSSTYNFQISLDSALDLFKEKQNNSFSDLYSQDIFSPSIDLESKADQEEVIACCGNFSFLLTLFAEDLAKFLKLASAYDDAKARPRSWQWLKFWKHNRHNNGNPLMRRDNSLNEILNNLQLQFKHSNELQLNSFSRKFLRIIWRSTRYFRSTEVQFGIRVGLGALFISFFAFNDRTKSTFNEWRLEWTLTIYCIMMNKSLGGTSMTVKYRFIGTFLGAMTAYLVWVIFSANKYVLAFSGFIVAIPCFYIIIYWSKNNAFGRFILLTYNLTALYSYSMLQKDSEDGNEGGDEPIIMEIALHRFMSVSIGIIWALIMASCFLPNSARSRLKNGIIVLWLRLGAIWNIGPLNYSETGGQRKKILNGFKDEKGIGKLLFECETLIKQAPLEIRLKGPFPEDIYTKLLKRTSTIIDAYHNMALLIEVDDMLSLNEEFVLNYTQAERDELEDRLFLSFYMISSAMKLSIPLPRKPASTQHAKDRMLLKLSETRNNPKMLQLKNEDYVLLYSYILVISIISEQLDSIIDLLRDLLGNISADSFELF